jgi:hypothetical protein
MYHNVAAAIHESSRVRMNSLQRRRIALGGTLDEHLLERRSPLPEINVRVVGHQFVPPCCTRRYPSASGPASSSAGLSRADPVLRAINPLAPLAGRG